VSLDVLHQTTATTARRLITYHTNEDPDVERETPSVDPYGSNSVMTSDSGTLALDPNNGVMILDS
jgi:hypothetical protein